MNTTTNTAAERRAVVERETETDWPREAWEHVGTVMSVLDWQHTVVSSDEDAPERPDPGYLEEQGQTLADWLRQEHGATVVLPISYYNHGVVTVWVGSPSDPWDSGYCAVIFDTPERRAAHGVSDNPEQIESLLTQEVKEIDQHLTGDVWAISVQRKVTWQRLDTGETRDEWITEDYYTNILGRDNAIAEARCLLNEDDGSRLPVVDEHGKEV